jgi:hypothetical protein
MGMDITHWAVKIDNIVISLNIDDNWNIIFDVIINIE